MIGRQGRVVKTNLVKEIPGGKRSTDGCIEKPQTAGVVDAGIANDLGVLNVVDVGDARGAHAILSVDDDVLGGETENVPLVNLKRTGDEGRASHGRHLHVRAGCVYACILADPGIKKEADSELLIQLR